jgi:hypothetical protein
MGKGGRKGGTEDRVQEKIDRTRGQDRDSDPGFWPYLKMVEDWATRHNFSYTEPEVKQAWTSGQWVEDFILGKCKRR